MSIMKLRLLIRLLAEANDPEPEFFRAALLRDIERFLDRMEAAVPT